MITHGILSTYDSYDLFDSFDSLIHEIRAMTDNDAKSVNKKVMWGETKVYDNSNNGRYKKLDIYREKWR